MRGEEYIGGDFLYQECYTILLNPFLWIRVGTEYKNENGALAVSLSPIGTCVHSLLKSRSKIMTILRNPNLKIKKNKF